MREYKDIPMGDALKAGFGLTFRSAGVIGLGALAEIAGALLSLGVRVALFALVFRQLFHLVTAMLADALGRADLRPAPLESPDTWLVPLAGATLASLLIVFALRALWMGAAVKRFTRRVTKSADDRPLLALAAEGFWRVVPVGVLFVPIWIAALAASVTFAGAGGLLLNQCLQTPGQGVLGALAFALGATLALLSLQAVELLFRIAIVRAVSADAGPIDALADAARLLWRRLGAFAALLILFGLLKAAAVSLMGSGGFLLFSGDRAAMATGGIALLGAGLVGVLLFALVATAELAVYALLDLSADGRLPEPAERPERKSCPPPSEELREAGFTQPDVAPGAEGPPGVAQTEEIAETRAVDAPLEPFAVETAEVTDVQPRFSLPGRRTKNKSLVQSAMALELRPPTGFSFSQIPRRAEPSAGEQETPSPQPEADAAPAARVDRAKT